MSPATTGPRGWSLASKDVVTPKFAPAPRRAQKSSGSVSPFTSSVRASAVMRRAERRVSQQAPKSPESQPSPPPSVRPGAPTPRHGPRTGARPCRPAAPAASPAQAARLGGHYATVGIDADLFERGKIDDKAVGTAPRQMAVTARTDRDFELVVPRKLDRAHHILLVPAADDGRRFSLRPR